MSDDVKNKPEGPAQEPQSLLDAYKDAEGFATLLAHAIDPSVMGTLEGVSLWNHALIIVERDARQKRALTREKNWLVEAVENCPDPVLKLNCKQLLANDYTNAAVQFIADAQTAAKDAEWRRVVESYKTQVDKRQALLDEMPCGHPRIMMLVSAETGEDLHCWLCDYRDQLRDANTLRVAAERERDSLLLLLEQSQKENALLYEELTQLKARFKELMNHLSSSGT